MNLFDRCRQFTRAREIQAAGYYPYFVPIEGSYDTEVIIRGESKVMVGSNNYLGLTHHPKVLAAAEAALKRYGSGGTGRPVHKGTQAIQGVLDETHAPGLSGGF
jgi:8-amino-7-oxononanoate synthase